MEGVIGRRRGEETQGGESPARKNKRSRTKQTSEEIRFDLKQM